LEDNTQAFHFVQIIPLDGGGDCFGTQKDKLTPCTSVEMQVMDC
jgi:hypothetical protein